MIKFISIKNIVLIESLKIEFDEGFTVFSGETGAGKSIILNCLSLAVGRRSDISFLRKGASEGSVTVEFDIEANYSLKKELDLLSLGSDSNSIFLRRVLKKDGKSKAFINDNPVTVNLLQKVGSSLVEIHGQNEKIGLLDTSSHLKLLDKYGGYYSFLLDVKEKYDIYKKLYKIYIDFSELNKNKEKYEHDLENNINLIKKLNLEDGEEKNLKEKKVFLSQYEKIFNVINKIYFLLSEENNHFTNELSVNAKKLEVIVGSIGEIEELKQINMSLNNILLETKEVTSNIKIIREKYHFDQKELEDLEQRLFDINNIARRFGVEPNNLLNTLKDFEEQYNRLEKDSEKIDEVKIKLDKAKLLFEKSCNELSLKRAAAAKKLEYEINSELKPLKLLDANFKIAILKKDQENWNNIGAEQINFLVRLNRGAKEAEIHKVSSGGELSRLMLAINLVLAKSLNPKTLVFDEVDSGVSGSVADSVGARLLALSKLQQVLVVTHLPQVASRGKNHYRSFKFNNKTEAFTGIEKLNKKKRVEEIAKMISGEVITEEAIKVANQLLSEK